MNPDTLATLIANGYTACAVDLGDGERTKIIGAELDWYYREPGDFAAGKRTPMREATASVCVLELAVDVPTVLSGKLQDALVAILAPRARLLKKGAPKPLVRATLASAQFIYLAQSAYVGMTDDLPGHRPLFEYGLRTTDGAIATLTAACSDVFLDGATWLNDESPVTRARAELPTWDAQAMAPKLRAFVDQFIAAGDLVERGPYVPAPQKPLSHEERLALQGVRVVHTDDDVVQPMVYADPRVAKALQGGPRLPRGDDNMATRRRG